MLRHQRAPLSRGALRAFVVNAVAVLSLTAAESGAQSSAPPTFTDSQATRGQLWFEAACQTCHHPREMSSPDFKLRWGGLSALDLFERIRTTMPQADPGSLSPRAYTDVVTYLMQLNGLPAGSIALTADSASLATVRLAFTPSSPAPR